MPTPRLDSSVDRPSSDANRSSQASLLRPASITPPSSEAERLLAIMSSWLEAGALRALDLALTRFLAQQAGEQDAAVLLAVALTSERNGHGHVCFDLQGALAQPDRLLGRLRDDQALSPPVRQALRAELQALSLDDWAARLVASSLVSNRLEAHVESGNDSGIEPTPEAAATASEDASTPLVLAGTREQPLLYLRRYWGYEERIRAGIEARLQRRIAVDPAVLRRELEALFQVAAPGDQGQPPAQSSARANAKSNARANVKSSAKTSPKTSAKTSPSPSMPCDSALARGSPSQSPAQLQLDLGSEPGLGQAAQRFLAPQPVEPEPEQEPDSEPGAGPNTTLEPNWQRIACALAAQRAFSVITGGPGTGKTTTVVRLLAVLQGLAAAAQEPPLRIELAAPTGKAAARLNESIAEQVQGLPGDLATDGLIPTEVKTLHRLLGTRPDSRHFRHHIADPLPADVVVVDEASMVDVEMMASLLDAMRPDARLILLGDKDQLSSVEAGAVLGDLCQRAADAHYRPETIAWLKQAAGEHLPPAYCDAAGNALDQAVVMLRKSYRFSEQGGIGALAALVNQPLLGSIAPGQHGQHGQRLGAVLQLFERERQRPASELGAIEVVQLAAADAPALKALTGTGYAGPGSYLTRMRDRAPAADVDQRQIDAWAREVLTAQKQFQLLTPLRQGDWGVEGL
ncbi:exodeoxyribonuclease V subunit alpha, partial [Halochromatium sp.]